VASNYPSGLDSFTNPAGTDNLAAGIGHAAQHANANDAIEAIEGELGLNPRGGSATVKARFDAIEANSWVTSARIADGTITGTDIASGTVTSTNILDGTIVNADINASAAIDISKISGGVASATVGNLLTTNQATLETDSTGWGTSTYQCTAARSTAAAYSGSASLLMTATGNGNIQAFSDATSGITVGQTYTVSFQAKVDAAATSATYPLIAGIRWLTSGSVFISDSVVSAGTINKSGWTRGIVSAVAPATAAKANVLVYMQSVTSGDKFYVDEIGLWSGAGGLWCAPGVPIPDLGTYTDESVGRRIFTWDTVNSRWQMTYGDTGDRNAAITYTNNWANSYGVDRLRRIGNTVYLVAALDSTNATADAAFTVPSGFRPTLAAITSIAIGGGSNVPRTLSLGSNGVGTIYRASLTPQGGWQLTVAYPTNDAWPASLPGTASGSIPT